MAAPFARKVSRFFKRLGVVGYSKKRNILGVHPIVISTIYIAFTLLLATFLRKLINSILGENVFKRMLLEFIATIELCAACYELIIVADNWGIWAYAFYLFALTVWWGLTWDSESACPYNAIEDLLEGVHDVSDTALVIFAQLLGALVTFRYVQIMWAMELVETHRGRAFEECVADLQVHVLLGALVEGAATCACRITARVLAAVDSKMANVINAFFGTLMVVLAFNFSGGYFNPALATSLKLGCEGNTFIEHMVVYWIGATIGSVLSVILFRTKPVQDYVKSLNPKED